jgi:tetratricopeptide (TPR) repeat protein
LYANKTNAELDPQSVAKNELLDREFLTIYHQAIKHLTAQQADDAISSARTALKKRPNSARAVAVIATAYKIKKDYAQAIKYFQQATDLFNDKTQRFEKASTLYQIAFCYELLGQRSSAIAAWQIYITIASNYPQEATSLAFARERIKTLTYIEEQQKKKEQNKNNQKSK